MSESSKSGGELFIVDNSDEAWRGLKYLQDWTEIASAFDIATGYFEIGALLALDGKWQKLDKIRILMGNEVSSRTRQAILDGLKQDITTRLNDSIESEKEKNDFLTGVAAIVQALRAGKIECRAYAKRKFHAKAYITHPRVAVIGSVALVGSSNFTLPGLTQNIELNIQVKAAGDVRQLQDWFELHWNEAENITPDILATVERHIRDYTPFDVYAKALDELFRRHELTASEWEKSESKIYPILDQYQRDGYASLYHTASNYNGAFLCDGVGLGKTFIGLMLIERLVMYQKKRVVLFVPKSGRVPVWERNIRKYLPHLLNGFLSFKIFNHTDLMRGVSADGTDFPSIFEQMTDQADAVVIDEAHHFRNRGLARESGGSRYWTLYDLCANKQVFHLTATPVNNALTDFQHLIELFSRDKPDAFATRVGIHNLAAHFRQLEKHLAGIVSGQVLGELFTANSVEAGQVLFNDKLFRELVVQRSRAYVVESQKQQGSSAALFPTKEDPRVAEYSVKKTYGHLLGKVEVAFAKEKPLFALAPYHPLDYPVGAVDEKGNFEIGRQRGLVRLIRIQFLKRFESSITAFEQSCQNLLLKFHAFLEKNNQSKRESERLEKWDIQNKELLDHIRARRQELNEEAASEETEDSLGEEFLDHFEPLDRKTYRVDEIFDDTYADLETLVDFLEELKKFTPAHDDKLKALVKLLKSDPDLKGRKVLVFTEYMSEYGQRIVDAYRIADGAALNEKKLWLQDDYVKFIRKAQTTIENARVGVFGFITNHGYLDNPTFRGMRQSLMGTFQQMCVLDLHGNANKKEESPDGSEDKNVFDIRQGVAICLATRGGANASIKHADLWGSRETKYAWLTKHLVDNSSFSTLTPDSPYYFFEPQNTDCRAEYDKGWKINEVMPVNSAGFITARDHFVVDFDKEALLARIAEFANPKLSDSEIRTKYFAGCGSAKYPDGDTRGWKVPSARKNVQSDKTSHDRVRNCLYRPFDERQIYWVDWMVDWPRPELTRHLDIRGNKALITTRITQDIFSVFVSTLPPAHKSVSAYDVNYVFPLTTAPSSGAQRSLLFDDGKRHPNFAPSFLRALASALKLTQSAEGLPQGMSPEDIFHYAYGVFHSPGYRSRYAEFLKIDFPRLPLTGNLELFRALARLGGELTALHLLESPKLDQPITEYIGGRNPVVEKVSWSKNTVWLDKAETTGFKGVREDVWNFHIGGYQVCEKWLKDRKDRNLSADDRTHYQKIIVALSETIRLMSEIDAAIAQHGGWPMK